MSHAPTPRPKPLTLDELERLDIRAPWLSTWARYTPVVCGAHLHEHAHVLTHKHGRAEVELALAEIAARLVAAGVEPTAETIDVYRENLLAKLHAMPARAKRRGPDGGRCPYLADRMLPS